MPPVRVLRVFTRNGGGNHLGVVTDLAGLDDAAMQSVATELGFSETIFLDAPRVRIFTPLTELSFAGHPLVGAAWVVAGGADGDGDLECGIGLVRYRVEGGEAWIDAPLPAGAVPLADGAARAEHFGVAAPQRSWMVAVPQPYAVFELAEEESVTAASPDQEAIASAGLSVYLVAPAAHGVTARFFAPALGVPEDPATGSAAVALAAVRIASGERHGRLVVHQGDQIGAPSTIHLRWDHNRASIGGSVAEDPPRHAGSR